MFDVAESGVAGDATPNASEPRGGDRAEGAKAFKTMHATSDAGGWALRAESATKFKAVSEAWETVGDPEKRARLGFLALAFRNFDTDQNFVLDQDELRLALKSSSISHAFSANCPLPRPSLENWRGSFFFIYQRQVVQL